ncbi:Cadmium/zinc-transporting ATPase HMA2 [Chlorella vulgaris]
MERPQRVHGLLRTRLPTWQHVAAIAYLYRMMLCRKLNSANSRDHSFRAMHAALLCSVASRAIDLHGHVHSQTCGHPAVEHEDHTDYLVEDELHHVTSSCCPLECSSGPVVVSHGCLSTLKHGRATAHPVVEQAGLRHDAASFAAPAAASAVSLAVGSAAGTPPQLLQTTRVFAAGICCPTEAPLIHSILDTMPGVRNVEVAVMTQTVTVVHDAALAPPAVLVAALNGAMLEASLAPPRTQAKVRTRWLPPWHVLAGAVLLLISLLHYLSGPTGVSGLEYLKYVSLGSLALCLPKIALRALLALRRMVMDIHLLMSLAAAGAVAIGVYTEAAAVVVLFAVAEHWERCSTDKARNAVAAVLNSRPESAKLAASGETVAVECVMPGTEVLVPPGESVPLDGTVVAGESAVDESLLTGESVPKSRRPGSLVHAGTINVGAGTLLVCTTAAAGDTAVARMATLVEQAASQQSPAEALVAKFARIYTPAVLVACALLAFLPWAWVPVNERSDWVYLSLQVLVTACPCALVLSTPATVVCALARAAGKGVLIKSGAALEALRRVSVVSFDKTGTLTKGSFQVVACQARNDLSVQEMLRLLGSLERGSSHPLAAAVLGYAASQGAVCDALVEGLEVVQGAGLVGTVDGRRVAAGTACLMELCANASGPEIAAAQHAIDAEGATACLVAVDGRFVGWLSARDVVRPEAEEAVAMLRRRGIVACMLTGDASAAASAVGAATGILPDCVFSQLLPQEKLDKVAELKHPAQSQNSSGCCPGVLPSAACCLRRRPARVFVAHCGDGVNDAPALAAADAGIAMGMAGSAAALEAGSVALFTNDIRAVPAALLLARAAGTTIWQNIIFSVVTKVAVLVPAALGRFTLWGAVLVDVGSSLLVVANALRLLKWRWPVVKEAASHKTSRICSSGSCSVSKLAPTTAHGCIVKCGRGCKPSDRASSSTTPCCDGATSHSNLLAVEALPTGMAVEQSACALPVAHDSSIKCGHNYKLNERASGSTKPCCSGPTRHCNMRNAVE